MNQKTSRGKTSRERPGRFAAAVACVLTFALVSACTPAPGRAPAAPGGGSPAAGGAGLSGKIVFLERWPEPQYKPFWDKVVADYMKANPNVQIDHQAIADQPYKDKIRVLTAANQLPDIYFSWAGDFAKKFVRAGLAADLTKEVKGTEWGNRLAPAAVDAFTYDGKVYGIPINQDGKFFAYNKKMFADNGIQVPTNLDQLLQACDTLKGKGIQPIAFGNKDGWAAIHYITSLNAKFVPRQTLDKDYDAQTGEFTDPGYARALQTFGDLNARCLTPGANGIEHGVAQAQLLADKAAMQYIQTVEFQAFTEAGGAPPEFAQNWDFFAMPDIPGAAGDQKSLTGAPDGFIVNAKSQNLPVAIDFLRFLTNEENGQGFTKTLGRLSSVKGTATAENATPQLIKALDAISNSSGYNIWLDTVAHIEVANAYLAGVQAQLDGSKTPERIVADVQAAAKKAKQDVGAGG